MCDFGDVLNQVGSAFSGAASAVGGAAQSAIDFVGGAAGDAGTAPLSPAAQTAAVGDVGTPAVTDFSQVPSVAGLGGNDFGALLASLSDQGALGAGGTTSATALNPAATAAATGAGASPIAVPNAPAAPTTAGGAGAGGAVDPTGQGNNQGGIFNWLKRNSNWLVPGLGVGASVLKGQQPLPYQKQIGNNVATESALGKNLAQTIVSGNLPPGAQAYLDQYSQAAKAQINSFYANNGLGNSSMAAEAIAQVEQSVASMKFQMATSLTSAGLNAINMADSTMATQAQTIMQQDSNLSTALANFAGALSLAEAIGQGKGNGATI